MSDNKIVLLNGPMGCGKTCFVNYYNKDKSQEDILVKAECKEKLHKLTQEFFSVPEEKYFEIYNNRKLKEKPTSMFSMGVYDIFTEFFLREYGNQEIPYISRIKEDKVNLSIREAMILVSEIICKPSMGEDYFGLTRVQKILNSHHSRFIDDSCGFEEELPPLIKELGQDNILLIRIHKEGLDFKGDSRGYIPIGVIHNEVDVYNNSDEASYLARMKIIVDDFIFGEWYE